MAGGGGGPALPERESPLAAKGLIKRKSTHLDTDFDITAMVDLVSLMNIYFLVTSLTAISAELDLPAAKHVKATDKDKSTVILVVTGIDRTNPAVIIGEDAKGKRITDPDEQAEVIQAAVEKGLREKDKKDLVLIKAEKHVRLRDISRIATAATVEGVKLNLAVIEKDK